MNYRSVGNVEKPGEELRKKDRQVVQLNKDNAVDHSNWRKLLRHLIRIMIGCE